MDANPARFENRDPLILFAFLVWKINTKTEEKQSSMDKERYKARILEIANEEVLLKNQIKQLETSRGYVTLEQIKNVFLSAFTAEKDYLEADENKKAELVKFYFGT